MGKKCMEKGRILCSRKKIIKHSEIKYYRKVAAAEISDDDDDNDYV